MALYDVSLKTTSICIVSAEGSPRGFPAFRHAAAPHQMTRRAICRDRDPLVAEFGLLQKADEGNPLPQRIAAQYLSLSGGSGARKSPLPVVRFPYGGRQFQI
jgi:hypothetical protein